MIFEAEIIFRFLIFFSICKYFKADIVYIYY